MPTAIEKNLSRIPCIRARACADGSRRRSLWRDTAGGISLMYAIVLPGLIGLVGLGVETGYWYVDKRDLQTQADAGSLSGAWEVAWHRDVEVTPAATNEAVRNGFPNNPASTTIAVNHPPLNGPQAGNIKAVEVIVTQDYHPMFAGLFHPKDITIRARAVSTIIASGQACVLALNKTAHGAAENTGSSPINAPDCTIAANSTADDAIAFNGSNNILFKSAWTTGGVDTSGSSNVTLTDGAQTKMWPIDDPYANLSDDAPAGCDSNINPGNNGTTQVTAPHGSSPNNYRTVCNDIHVTNGNNVNFAPGIYWMKGSSLTVEGGTITCTACSPGGQGVTFIFTTPANGNVNQIGTVTINGNATVVLNAPSTGTYKGVLFFQDHDTPTASNKTANLNGGANTVLNGAMYFPNNEVQWAGNNSLAASCTLIIGDTVTFTGNSGFSVDDCANQGVNIAFTQKVSLVE